MPNWTEHALHVVGRKADIDRFVRVGYRNKELDFTRLCPPKRGEIYEPDRGLVSIHCRTKTQAFFSTGHSLGLRAELLQTAAH